MTSQFGCLFVLFVTFASMVYAENNTLAFGECSSDCDEGITFATHSCDEGICSRAVYSCNTLPCGYEPIQFGECSASCGFGTRVYQGDTAASNIVIPCASNPCEQATGDGCGGAVVVMIDGSDSFSDTRFQLAKDIVYSTVTILDQVTGYDIRIGVYDTDTVFFGPFTDDFDEILANIAAATRTGGADYVPNAIAEAEVLLEQQGAASKHLVLFSDADSTSIDKMDAQVNLARDAGINVILILTQATGQRMDGRQPYYSLGDPNVALASAKQILENSCTSYYVDYSPEESAAVNSSEQILNSIRYAGPADSTCRIEEGECSESCGAQGYYEKAEICKKGNEQVTNIEFLPCFTECTTTTTTPSPSGPDCTRCDYSRGQIWVANENNCHLYYICEKIVEEDGSVWYRIHDATCGELFWDPTRLTCVREPIGSCKVGPPVTWNEPSTTPVPCPYETLTDPQQFGSINVPDATFECVDGMHFDDSNSVCTCIQVSNIEPECSDDLLLDFPYDNDLDDVTCHHANGYSYPEDGVTIVSDPQRGNVAYLPGNAHIQVPFIRNWFKDQDTQAWTVTVFVKRISGDEEAGIVDNGDCIDQATFLIRGDGSGGVPSSFSGVTTNVGSDVSSQLNMDHGVWYKLALVYDGTNLYHYSKKVSDLPFVLADGVSKPLSGYILNTQNPMKIGMCDCDGGNPAYWDGYVDDLKIWTKAINPPN